MTQYDPNNEASEELDEESMRESVGPVTGDRAQRFYDRIRNSITSYLEKKAHLGEKSQTVLLLVPDMFMLLVRLVNDARVNAKNKMILGSGIAYFLFPIDLIPEGFLGPVGFADDLVLGAFLLNKLLAETDVEVLRQHWSGSEDVLQAIQRVLNTADSLIGSDVVGKIKKMAK